MQVSYHFVLTKIPKLQNLKKKKKTFFCTGRYARCRPVLPEIVRYGRYFFRYETGGSSVPDCWPVWYIPTVPTGTVRNRQPWLLTLFLLRLLVNTFLPFGSFYQSPSLPHFFPFQISHFKILSCGYFLMGWKYIFQLNNHIT